MAGSAVTGNKQEIIWEALGKLLQEHFHAHDVHCGQDEIAGSPILRRNRAIHIGVFADNLCWYIGADSFGCPAVLRFVDATKTGFVLKKYPERLAYRVGFFFGFCDKFRPVFLKASCASLSALGCLGRGAIFRQPCRCSIR